MLRSFHIIVLLCSVYLIITDSNISGNENCEVLADSISLWHLNGECLFSTDYETSRNKFLAAAKSAGAEVNTFEFSGKELFTDIALLRGDPYRYVLHISGVHGVEGYAGSAIQSLALTYLKSQQSSKDLNSTDKDMLPTIIFIHAVNPFGMKYNRRVNENNIDLNRNFLRPEDFYRVTGRDPNFAGYMDLDYLFNPNWWPLRAHPAYLPIHLIYAFLQSTAAVGWYGLLKLKRALVSGNYHKTTGLGFGGFNLSRSAQILIDLLQSEGLLKPLKPSQEKEVEVEGKHVVIVDVHTGLGPFGVDTLGANDVSEGHLETIFHTEKGCAGSGSGVQSTGGLKSIMHNAADPTTGTSSTSGGGGGGGTGNALSGYDLMEGDTCGGLTRHFLQADSQLCVIQEFGTINTVSVGQALILENYAYHFGDTSTRVFYGERLLEAFSPSSKQWRRSVTRRGLVVLLQALKHQGYTGFDAVLDEYYNNDKSKCLDL